MPTSHPYQLDDILQLIIETAPQSLLDVGVGFGKYGVLAREYLELWDENKAYDKWSHRIDGIDIFISYLTPLHDFIYDKIYIGNAIEILPEIDLNYDLILLIDILEHFEKDEGIKLLRLARERAKNLIISTPLDIGNQGEPFDNPYEKHCFQWRAKNLRILDNVFFISNRKSILCYCGEDAPRVKKRFLRRKRSTLFKVCLPHLASTHQYVKKLMHTIFPKKVTR